MKLATFVFSGVVGSSAAFSSTMKPNTPSTALRSTMETAIPGTVDSVVKPSTTDAAPSAGVVDGAVVIAAPIESGMDVAMPMKAETAPKNTGIQTGRYNDKENSIAVPFLKRPPALDGSHAGDFGFDPLGFTESYDLYTMQESELRHGRLAMLAVVGWPLSELLAPEWMLQNGRAPSVLNGVNPVSFIGIATIFAAIGYFEYQTSLRRVDDKALGKIHQEDMADVWEWGVAGDYNFDPLNLYSSISNDAYARKGLREVEISHGRSAMLGITGFAAWEALTGHAIVENSMFFHPNAMLPALVGAGVAFNQFYEMDDSSTFLRFKLSSEGEARKENLALGQSGESNFDPTAVMDFVDKSSKVIADIPAKYEKLQTAYYDNVVNYDNKY